MPLTGTSTFPLAGEELLERTARTEVSRDGLPRRRDGQVFEDLRARTASGDVSVPVLALGTPRDTTARLTFVTNLLGIAGIRPEVLEIGSADEIAGALAPAKGAPVAVLASSKQGYASLAEPAVTALREAGVGQVLVAGSTREVDVPVDGEIRDGMDVVTFLDGLLDSLGAEQAGATA